MKSLPNTILMSPADNIEACECVRKAAEINSPVYIRLGRNELNDIYTKDYKFEMGKGSVSRAGNDMTVIATGIMVYKALKAYDELKQEKLQGL